MRLRIQEFRQRAAKAGLVTDDDFASALGMNRTTIWRILGGRMAPGERFIAAVLATIPSTGFSDVFEIVTGSNGNGNGAA